ncbi:hypothetical protein C8J56DRAFT_568767 [Mycena floridula]|nr:hypothetical protein C8J56DRAFT_568767 [Mycena floridula]
MRLYWKVAGSLTFLDSFLLFLALFNSMQQKNSPPIDFVRISDSCSTLHDIPLFEILQKLRYPSHLEIICGWSEEFPVSGLDSLDWDLETLLLANFCTAPLTFSATGPLARIQKLTLQDCCGLDIRFSSPVVASITNLVISGNNALDMFINISRWTNVTVKSLTVKSGNQDLYRYSHDDLREALANLTNLTSLSLDLDVKKPALFAEIPRDLPATLTNFECRAQLYSRANIQHWMQCSENEGWLPNLETLVWDVQVHGDKGVKKDSPLLQRLLQTMGRTHPELKILVK